MGILKDLRYKDMQRSTWITHSLPVLSNLVVGLGAGMLPMMLWSWVIAVVFVAKEQRDKILHQRAGDYDTPDASGVSPRSDHVGDLIGPITQAVAITIAVFVAWMQS